ncbi:MAG: Lar family restriction alleviation protein [Methyloglobulus sp.]
MKIDTEKLEKVIDDEGVQVERQITCKLKPCPFCGGKAQLYTDGLTAIMCTDCSLTVSNYERSIIKLTDQWNGRAKDDA